MAKDCTYQKKGGLGEIPPKIKMKKYNTTIIFLAIFTFSLLFCLTEAKSYSVTVSLYNYKQCSEQYLLFNAEFPVEDVLVEYGISDLGECNPLYCSIGENFNDKISSFKVSDTCTVVLYSDTNYGGDFEIFRASPSTCYQLTKLNNRASSIRIFAYKGLYVAPSVLDFGDLYKSERDGAENYNKGKTQELTIGNNGLENEKLGLDYLEYTIRPHFLDDKYNKIFNNLLLLPDIRLPDIGTNPSLLVKDEEDLVTLYLNTSYTGTIDEYIYVRGNISANNSVVTGTCNVNVKAEVHDTPTVSLKSVDGALRKDNKYHVAVGESFTFHVESGEINFPDAALGCYQWQSRPNNMDAIETGWSDFSSIGERTCSLDNPGNYTIYVRMVDSNNVKTEALQIPFYVWRHPTIGARPPAKVIPTDYDSYISGSSPMWHVPWFSNTYVGVVNKSVFLKADGQTQNSPGQMEESILSYTWTIPNEDEFIQDAPQEIYRLFTPDTVNLNGTISVICETNYGIKSEPQTFNMKIYEQIDVNAGGSYDGIPFSDVALQGAIDNLDSYGANASADYKWRVISETGLYFNGETSYVKIPNRPVLNTLGPYPNRTISLWFKTSKLNQSNAILFESGKTYGFAIYINQNSVCGNTRSGGGLSGKLSGEIKADVWHHVALVLDGGSTLKLYLDGNLAKSHNNAQPVPTHGVFGYDKSNIGIGKEVEETIISNSSHFAGRIDDVAIFNRALSDAEISDLYNTELSVNESVPVGYWAFDEGQGDTAIDSSPFGSHGSLEADWSGSTHKKPSWPSLKKVNTESNGKAYYKWESARDAVYNVEFTATVITQEGYELTGADTTTVTIGAGRPVASIGGPYTGGIYGKDNSPIQVFGNAPDTYEPDTAGNDVTIQGWEWTFDKTISYNQGVQFSDDDEAQFGDLNLVTSSGFTVSVWVKLESQLCRIVEINKDHIILGFKNSKPFFRVNSVNGETAWSSFEIANGSWHHLVGMYDGEDIHLYLDGYLQESVKVSKVENAGEVSIPKGSWPFVGSVDDLSIWDRALSRVEIEALSVGKVPNDNGLVGYWPFDEGNDTNVGNQMPGGNDGTLSGTPEWAGRTLVTENIYNPTQTYDKAGEYSVSLLVKADTRRWSTAEETTVTVIDGSIAGTIRAADLRTPVSGVRLTLTSSHVWDGDLSSLADADLNISTDGSAIYTLTDVGGNYRFENLPLGSYRLVATKVEDNGTVHEFENDAHVVYLTLSNPNQPATDFVDISVFPVGGLIRMLPYDLNPTNPEVPDDELLVSDVVVEAKPVGSTSSVESDRSESVADATNRNYSLPMFGGKYQFFARYEGRDISIDDDVPGSDPIYTDDSGVTSAVRLVTITGATNQVHFTDPTQRTLTVKVEDSGGFPIQKLPDLPPDDNLYNEAIKVNATLSGLGKTATNTVEAETDSNDKLTRTFITYQLPPGKYTIKVHTDFEGQDIVFRDDEGNPDALVQQVDVDLTAGDGEITMVVPIKIQLAFGERPNLLDIFDTNNNGDIDSNDDFYELLTNEPSDDPPGFGLDEDDLSQLEAGLEGYIFYYAPDLQTHTYAIQATANGHPVEDYTLAVTDQISQESDDVAAQQTFTISALVFDTQADLRLTGLRKTLLGRGEVWPWLKDLFSDAGAYLSDDATIQSLTFPGDDDDKVDKWMITDGENTYFLQDDNGTLHVDRGTYQITGGLPAMDTQAPPNVVPKKISFQALKDGYRASDTKTDSVIVLGDRLQGTAAQIVSIPNINYLVLHDPPGDQSYAFVEDDLTVKGVVSGMKVLVEDDAALPVFPAPWSVERDIQSDRPHGLLGKRDKVVDAGASFAIASVIELATGASAIATGPVFAAVLQVAKAAAIGLSTGRVTHDTGLVQYEISVGRSLQTPSGDSLHDLMGPGKGDIYFGEGWTLGFQNRYRFGLKYDGGWLTETQEITTYDILDRTNQYVYTTRDIENIIENLDGEIAGDSDVEYDNLDAARKIWFNLLEKNIAYQWSEFYIENADKWAELNAKNASELSALEEWKFENLDQAKDKIAGKGGDTFEAFRNAMGLPKDSATASEEQKVETIIYSAGPEFEYSRTISEASMATFSTSVLTASEGGVQRSDKFGTGALTTIPAYIKLEVEAAIAFQTVVQTEQGLSGSYDSGRIVEQKVGFVLQDDDIGDNIATRVYEDPVWATPLFIHDLGSVTSDPWSPGTNKGVDLKLELIAGQLEFLFSPSFISSDIDNLDDRTLSEDLQSEFTNNGINVSEATVTIDRKGERWIINPPNAEYIVRLERRADLTEILNVYQETADNGPFDYHRGAHYTARVTYTGQRVQSDEIDFAIYAYAPSNTDSATARFNGGRGPYEINLAKSDSFADIEVSIYPPEIDQGNSYQKEYEVVIQVEEIEDGSISRTLTLTPRFADLQPPTAEIVAPYDGERISPAMFDDADDTFTIKVISSASDIETIRIESRSKRQDGVWGEWSLLGGLKWTDGVDAPPTDLGGNPARFRYIFDWTSTSINTLGVGEYQLRALATDKAGNPTVADNDLPTAPTIEFLVDASKPTVLTTVPNYQDKDSERIYRGELSITFTDDMREHDFTPNTFEVIDLLESDPLQKQLSGFVSYSPALRKAIFVPEVPFISNGYYKVTMKTDDDELGVKGVHDLAGNPLDQDFSWTFRTTDSPFEEEWSIVFSVTNGVLTDANNIAGVEYGALDMGDLEEDERDARVAPSLDQQIRFSFLDMEKVEFDRDMRPADGRLSHHWFFVIDNAKENSTVTIRWQPSSKLVSTLRQYQDIWLVEFEPQSTNVRSRKELDPTEATFNETTGEFDPIEAHTYTNEGETSRYFRLDVQKFSFVAETFSVGTSGWKFLSVPITPQLAEPFVNLGDDINPFQLYQYDTKLGGYKIYPFDIGEVSLQTGHGYFIRLEDDVEVDVGGTQNKVEVTLELDAAGWHAIGNPFVADVNVADLIVNGKQFADAVGAGLVGNTLYRWNIIDDSASYIADDLGADSLGETENADYYEGVTSSHQLNPWDGYWLETRESNLTLRIPAPDDLPNNPPTPDYLIPPMAPAMHAGHAVSLPKEQFSLKLALTSAFASDLTTTLGTHQNAKSGWDTLDSREPPILGQTVAAYFGKEAGKYNRDYQSLLKAGEQRTWQLTVYTDKSDAEMTLSWEETIKSVPDDIMLTFRRTDEPNTDWQDMRQIQSVELTSSGRITNIPFEVRAERFVIAPPADVKVVAGEKRVTIKWKANDNPFIDGYTIYRAGDSDVTLEVLAELEANANQFVDVGVEGEATYTYQVTVQFRTGAERHSERFTVTVLPVIKQTILLQSYPNPFNPETWIPYELAQEADVRIDIYNASGQLVRTLELGRQSRGRYVRKDTAVHWDGRNRLGEHAANGLYFYVLKAGNFTAARKMVIVK